MAPPSTLLLLIVLKCCLAEEEEYPSADYRKAPRTRVLGVGLGVFLLVFFFMIGCAICWIGSVVPEDRCPPQTVFNIIGTTVFGLVALILLFADAEPRYESREDKVVKYRENFVGLVLVTVFGVTAASFGVGAVLCYHMCQEIEMPAVASYASDRAGVFDSAGRCLGPLPTIPL